MIHGQTYMDACFGKELILYIYMYTYIKTVQVTYNYILLL